MILFDKLMGTRGMHASSFHMMYLLSPNLSVRRDEISYKLLEAHRGWFIMKLSAFCVVDDLGTRVFPDLSQRRAWREGSLPGKNCFTQWESTTARPPDYLMMTVMFGKSFPREGCNEHLVSPSQNRRNVDSNVLVCFNFTSCPCSNGLEVWSWYQNTCVVSCFFVFQRFWVDNTYNAMGMSYFRTKLSSLTRNLCTSKCIHIQSPAWSLWGDWGLMFKLICNWKPLQAMNVLICGGFPNQDPCSKLSFFVINESSKNQSISSLKQANWQRIKETERTRQQTTTP